MPLCLKVLPWVLWTYLAGASLAQEPGKKKVSANFEADIAELETKKVPGFPAKAVLFTGSSSIRKWELSRAFPGLETVNLGFGGSRMVDLNHFADRIVFPCKPATLVVYEGDNDIHEGFTPKEVASQFGRFLESVNTRLPATRVLFLAVKPSPSRLREIHHQKEFNGLLREFCAKSGGRAVYVDTFSPILGPDGTPDKALFQDDQLHLNDKGYARWKSALEPLLK